MMVVETVVTEIEEIGIGTTVTVEIGIVGIESVVGGETAIEERDLEADPEAEASVEIVTSRKAVENEEVERIARRKLTSLIRRDMTLSWPS
jgi:hypothetical protein